MLIINADDFGRTRLATDRTIDCHTRGSITSTSAMVFMEDSQRAADRAGDYGIDAGLHLNFTTQFTQLNNNSLLHNYHDSIVGYLTRNNYNFLIYNPVLRKQFEYIYQRQIEEFERLYGMPPSHINGHHHMHICANMLFGDLIPEDQCVRRNLSFTKGEKSFLNRTYRSVIDKWLARRYQMTDYFFSLSQCIKTGRLATVLELTKSTTVELETHPELEEEFVWLMGNECFQAFSGLRKGTFTKLNDFHYSANAL